MWFNVTEMFLGTTLEKHPAVQSNQQSDLKSFSMLSADSDFSVVNILQQLLGNIMLMLSEKHNIFNYRKQ